MINLNIKQFTKIAILLLSVLFIQSCASFRAPHKKDLKKISKKSKNANMPRYVNFDKKSYSNDSYVIANMIAIVQPELEKANRNTIASQISVAIKKYKVEPQIIVAIIDTESDFKADKVSSTGDLSVAQINVEVWNKEFIRMKMPPLIKEKIKHDQAYAIMKMAEIINILKKRYEKKDRRWYARYHSNTHKYKSEYLHKLEIRMKMLAASRGLSNRLAQVDKPTLKKSPGTFL